MPLKTLVKVGSITNLSDARYCAGMGVDMLGFCVIENEPAYITPQSFQEIRGWITGPKIVAQIQGLKSAAALDAILELYRPDLLEMNSEELALLGSVNLPYILATSVSAPSTSSPALAYLLTSELPASDAFPTLLRINHLKELDAALNDNNVKGIALEGSNEIRPGLKTYDDLGDILEALEDNG